MTFYDRLMCTLIEKGKTPAQLCEAIGINKSTFYQWNSRKSTPTPATLGKICQYLECDAWELLGKSEVEQELQQERHINIQYLTDYNLSESQKILFNITKNATPDQIARLIEFWYKEVKDNV